jgi:hypothetical protein
MLFFALILVAASVWAIRTLWLIVFRDTLYLSYARGSTPRRVRGSDHRFERNAQVICFLLVLVFVAVSAVVVFR